MSSSSPPSATTSMAVVLFLLIITILPSLTMTQPNLPVTPTFSECGPRILPLAMCAPFVQGVSTDPSQSCCDNLRHVNNQQPRCLCLLLNNSALRSTFPINATLAMQLPLICSVNFDIVSCTGAPSPSMSPTPHVPSSSMSPTPHVPSSSMSPSAQVSLGSTTNSSVASSPMASAIPKSGFMGLGFYQNYAMKFKGSSRLRMLGIVICMSTSMLY